MSDSSPTTRLRVSPAYVLAFSPDGRPYVARDSEPYVQYWLTERERVLHGLFAGRRGATPAAAVAEYFRVCPRVETPREARRLRVAIDEMRAAGVLVGQRDDLSRYTAAIVDDYVRHRPFPADLAARIVAAGPVTAGSRVLDLAGGPGDLALALAQAGGQVALMDLSAGFLRAATRRAAAAGLALDTIHDSCNRLLYRDDEFDVITISQALHWLDDVAVCRGVCRLLRPGGSFFVVHASIDVADDHPLAMVLGRRSMLGHKPPIAFAEEVTALGRRVTRLFDALDTPDVERIDLARRAERARVVPVAVTTFVQRRPFDAGYVNGFLTDAHITAAGHEPARLRREVAVRAAAAQAGALTGTMHWAILQFTRGGVPLDDLRPASPVPIGFSRPDARGAA